MTGSEARFVRALTWPALLVGLAFVVELLARQSLPQAAAIVFGQPVPFLTGMIVLWSLVLGTGALSGLRRGAFVAVAGFWMLGATFSGTTLRILGRPGLAGDAAQLGEAAGVIRVSDVCTPFVIGVWSTAVVLVVLGLRRAGGPDVSSRIDRVRVLVGSILLAAAGASASPRLSADGNPPAFVMLQLAQLRQVAFEAYGDERESEAGREGEDEAALQPPAGLAARVMQAGLEDAAAEEQRSDGPRTNVLVVLSESFFDPTTLPNVTFSEDPLPFYHSLLPTTEHGFLVSPEYGGSTANVEFEVLTGLSRQFVAEGAIAYRRVVKRPIDSLASIARRSGYRATAITPWPHWFFNSENAFRQFGFDRFLSVEFIDRTTRGEYVADADTTRMILDEVRRGGPSPWFIFANTSENHIPWYAGKFPGQTMKVTGLSREATIQLESYAEGSKRVDAMLRALVEAFRQSPEPTIIAWFGDHLPALGPDYLVYTQARLISGPEDPDFERQIHRVPYFIWSNRSSQGREMPVVGTHQLFPRILAAAGLRPSPYAKYLMWMRDRVPYVPPKRSWSTSGLPRDLLEQFEAVQRDIVKGEQTIYGSDRTKIVSQRYQLGHGPIRVDAAVREGARIAVRGANFPRTLRAVANGATLRTRWIDDEHVEIEAAPSVRQLELRVVDGHGDVIVRAGPITPELSGRAPTPAPAPSPAAAQGP